MRIRVLVIAVVAVAALGSVPSARAPQGLQAPASIQTEHHDIHEALVALTKGSGPVAAAAKELAATLHPHFVREEEIALPPLGLLAPLAAGKTPAGMSEALTMAETLKKEMPRMLEEHKAIRAATAKLARAATDERHAAGTAFAATLALHAQTEEEVLYPAAILVAELIRARMR